MFRILFVCTGNTCRSPMAEALLRQKIHSAQLEEQILVLSAGAFASGETASKHARQVMKSRGLNLDEHAPRQLSAAYVQAADLILTMTESHKRHLLNLWPDAAGKTYTLTEFTGQAGEVSDPFGGTEASYEACARQLENLLDSSWQKIVEMAGTKG